MAMHRFLSVVPFALPFAFASPLQSRAEPSMIHDFAELTPSPEINWQPCFNDFTCTVLEVPLDYTDDSAGTTGIAFIKKAAKNEDAPDILINPGGPGGSGVDAVLVAHSVYTEKLGDQYNIIGFDPRGVNNSGPSLSCFPNDPLSTIAQNIFFADVFNPVRNDTLERGFAKSGAYGDWCTKHLAKNGTAGYANTVGVAHDMLRYIETAAKEKGSKPEEAKLWYYGISYGTVLGATYASLFPDRIERMLIDGVVDSEDYYNGQWHTALTDTDAAVRSFFKYCYEAGPELCSFHQNANSEDALRQRYLRIFQSLEAHPIEVADPALDIPPVTITWEDLSLVMFSMTYAPQSQFPQLALGLTELEKGNATLLAIADVESIALVRKGYDSREVRTQTSCIDANGRFNLSTIEQYREHVNFQNELSFFGGAFLSGIIGGPCRNLDIYPPESQVVKDTPSADKTSAPILFIGNTRDPITPLVSAKKMSSLFGGSEVLTLDSTGHGTFGFASKCIDDYMRAYLKDKSLPPPNTTCELDEIPFQPTKNEKRAVKRFSGPSHPFCLIR